MAVFTRHETGGPGSGDNIMDRMRQIARGFVILIIFGALLSCQVSAQPIKAPCVITSPGMYELSEDARDLTDTYGIKVECSNVVIDGGSHFLGGENREKSVGVFVNLYGGSITNITVKNLLLEDWDTGVTYSYVKGKEGDSNLITNCDIVNSGTAIHVDYSDYIFIEDNQIKDCSSGIVVDEHSTFSIIEKNSIRAVGLGTSIIDSTQIRIDGNNINTCEVYGLQVTDSDLISVIKNAISDNKYAAFRVDNTKKLNISGNNFSKTITGPVLIVGNDVHEAVITDNWFGSYEDVSVDEVSSGIIWNVTKTPGVNILGGPYLGGNYWGSASGDKGFSDTAPDIDGFGISDKPYQINGNNIDYLPLTYTTATKAPEEQNLPPIVIESEETADILPGKEVIQSDQDATMAVQVPVSAGNSNISENATSPVILNVVEKGFVMMTPVSEIPNLTNDTVQVIVPEINYSVLNRSVTNGFSSNSPDSLQPEPGIPGEQDMSDADKMIPSDSANSIKTPVTADTRINGQNMTGQEKTTAPAMAGYLVFTSSEPNYRVILTTTSNNEVALDPMEGNNLTVPVPVERVVYSRYRIEKDGFISESGEISSYPGSGQTITIPVTLIRNADNSTNPQVNQTGRGTPSSVLNQTLPAQVNNTLTVPVPVSSSDGQSISLDTSFTSGPVISNNIQPISVTNGVVQEKSTKFHVITATAGSGGAIYPRGVQIHEGDSITFVIEPDEGKHIAYLVIDGIQTGPMSEYRFINVTSDHTIVTGFL
jgi:hypothetical protein